VSVGMTASRPFRDSSVPDDASRSLGPPPPLLKSLPVAESWHGHEVAAHSVRRTRRALPPLTGAALRGVSSLPLARSTLGSHRAILSHGSAFYRVFPAHLASVLLRRRLSWGSTSPSAPSEPPATCPECPPRVPPTSTVSHRPRGHSSDCSFPGLFHPGSTPGVLPSGDSPRTQRSRLITESSPLVVATVATVPLSRVPRTAREKGWLDFRVSPRPSPFAVKKPG